MKEHFTHGFPAVHHYTDILLHSRGDCWAPCLGEARFPIRVPYVSILTPYMNYLNLTFI